MKSLYGYLIAGIGLVGLVFSSPAIKKLIPALENVSQMNILVPALVLVVVGVLIIVLVGKKGGNWNVKQSAKEVPIYKGEGKKRKIVGYKVEG